MTALPAQASPRLRTPEDFPLYAPGLPLIGPTLGLLQDPIGYHLRARRELGPIYRTSYLGKESLCLGGVDVNEFIWRNDKLWNYGVMRTPFAHQFGDDYLTQLDGQPHKKKRMRLNPSFRPDFLMSGTPKMNATARENLARVAGHELDLRQFCYRLLLRMTTQGMLGLELSEEEEKAILQVEKDLLLARRFGPAWKMWFKRPVYTRAKKRVMQFLGELVDRWTADPARAPQMYTLAVRTAEGDTPPSREELMGDIYLLITGGLNSNANLILWTLMYVFHRPEWVRELQAEVAAVPPEQFSAMKQWPKIKATILEIERLRPGTVVNVLIPTDDFEFQGIAFKKGRPITHFSALPHFQEEIYEDALEFRPERHLGDKVYPGKAHATFGGGSHMCIGMPLARLQSPLILANLLAGFTIEFSKRPSFRATLASSLTPAGRTVPAHDQTPGRSEHVINVMTTVPAPASVPLRTPKDFPRYAPGLPLLGPTLGLLRDPIGYHLAAYRRFGPIYRTSFLGSESLCLSGMDVNEFVWRNSELWNYGITRSAFREEFGDDYLTQLDGQKHKKKRVRLNPSFRPDFLMSGSAKMIATARENLAQVAGQTLDLRQFCYRLLLRMTTKGMLGLDLPAETEDAILQVERDLLLGGLFGPARRLWFNRPVYRRAKKRVMQFLGEMVERWTADPANAPEMFKLATKTPEGSPPLTADELMGDLYLLITGGLNSTANLILWTLMYVYHRPDWVPELQAEVAAVPPEQFSAMKQWPKIKATLLEVERLRPATPVNVLIPAADFEYGGIAFQKGRPVTHFLVLPHFQPEVYEEPEAFRPERHLGDKLYPGKAHATFGGGAHMCIGMPLARLQSPLILASILQDYAVEFAGKPSFLGRLSAALTPADKTVMATIQRRS